jgi:glycerol-3-phosphate cytidylyltransferase
MEHRQSFDFKSPGSPRRVITFGTFDVLHMGHLRLIERASRFGDQLIVGISTDALNYQKKQRYPIYHENDRLRLVGAMRCVHEVFFEESLDLKRQYIARYRADILVMGDDWKGRFDFCDDLCEVVYLDRTPSISTTELIEVIRQG